MEPDLFDMLDEVTKGSFTAMSIFNSMKHNRSWDTNITKYVPNVEMTPTERQTVSRRIKELKDVGLIRRVNKEMRILGSDGLLTFKDPRTTYIINPEMLIPNDYNEAEYLWNQCELSK